MKETLLLSIVLGLCATGVCAEHKTHLFILSGQSNMTGLNPDLSFTPAVTKAFPDDEIIVVKDARSGQPIRRWVKNWKSASGESIPSGPSLFTPLMEKVKSAIAGKKLDTVTFVWMQGERDAKEGHAAVYAASLKALLDQVRAEPDRKDLNYVIGRLSDYGLTEHIPGWKEVRQAQEEVAKADPRGAWVDTDDLNGPNDGLHYTKDGYLKLGERFANKAIEQIRANE